MKCRNCGIDVKRHRLPDGSMSMPAGHHVNHIGMVCKRCYKRYGYGKD